MSASEGFPFKFTTRNIETEPFHCPQQTTQCKKPRISETSTPINQNPNFKTHLCRRFRQGACVLGSHCNYAHGVAELRRQQGTVNNNNNRVMFQEPKLCRMFSQNKTCTYGHTCRFLHLVSNSREEFKNAGFDTRGQAQGAELGKLGGYSSTEYRAMQTSAATNVSTSTVATSPLHKNGPYGVKCIFKKNELQRISRIYADWI